MEVIQIYYYISDLHLGSKSIIKRDNRPFASVEEMDGALIKRWNAKVKETDNIFIIGDLSDAKDCYKYIKALKGRKHLIVGNHDTHIVKDKRCKSLFETISFAKTIFDPNAGKKIVLSHYPYAEWEGYYRGYYHIHGHIHGKESESFNYMTGLKTAFNAGCMLNDYEPKTFAELEGAA